MSETCLVSVWKVSRMPRLNWFSPIWSWKISGSVLMLSRLFIEGVWKVHVRCLEGGLKVSCWPLLVGVWRVSGGCLEGVWKVSETCLVSVWKVSVRPRISKLV